MATATANTWLTVAATVLLLDAAWLSITGSWMYAPMLALVQGSPVVSVRSAGGAVAYAALITGLNAFAVPMAGGKAAAAMRYGGLFGLVAYAVYNGTNYATLHAWKAGVSVVDTAWGMTLSAIATTMGVLSSSH